MDQEIIKPEIPPRRATQATGALGCFLAAAGATLLALTKLGAAMAATVWAACRLFGVPDEVMWGIMALGAIPVLWATIWTAGRAWHVEQRLEAGLDIDPPVFKLMHYWRRT
jgi:hypothetical protein